jgi:hypothetical protein
MSKPASPKQMMTHLSKYFKSVREEDDTFVVSGEHGDEFNGLIIYDYYNESSLYQEVSFGVLNYWEKDLNSRGWYSQWIDPGTVRITPE